MTADEPSPFTSLRALQLASDQLIQGFPDDEALISDQESEECTRLITRFIDQAVVTGVVLDAPSDRRAAQALIDFWVAKSSKFPRDRIGKPRRSTRTEILLEPFRPEIVD